MGNVRRDRSRFVRLPAIQTPASLFGKRLESKLLLPRSGKAGIQTLLPLQGEGRDGDGVHRYGAKSVQNHSRLQSYPIEQEYAERRIQS
jgi:hypothetical protein